MTKRTVAQAVFDSKDALRIAKAATKQATEELNRMHPSQLDEGNPNHPMYDQIFGYDRDVFMVKQYK